MNDKDTVVVPRVPTPEMIWAYDDSPYEGAEDKWSAMLAAAPSTSVREEVQGRVRISAWNAAKKAGATGEVGYAVADAIAAEFAALKPSTDKGDVG